LFRRLLQLLIGAGAAGLFLFLWSSAADAAPAKPAPKSAAGCVDKTAVTNVSYSDQNGALTTQSDGQINGVDPGDTVTVRFSVVATQTCPNGVEVSFVSYHASQPFFTPVPQQIADAKTATYAPGGPYTITIQVPLTSSAANDPSCNPQHDNSNGGGANQSPGPYDVNGCGLPTGNGRSDSNNSSMPCAGCVGNADAKNPPGQYPNGGDPNAGYECDRNQGVGQTNPAHTGCTSPGFQIDFVSGQPITDFSQATYGGQNRLIGYANGG
jgi:hypothetical protein